MSASVSFQIKGIIKALAAKGAQVSLGITVALHVPVEEPLQAKVFRAHPALELARISFGPEWGQFLGHPGRIGITGQGVLDAKAPVDQLDWGVRR